MTANNASRLNSYKHEQSKNFSKVETVNLSDMEQRHEIWENTSEIGNILLLFLFTRDAYEV